MYITESRSTKTRAWSTQCIAYMWWQVRDIPITIQHTIRFLVQHTHIHIIHHHIITAHRGPFSAAADCQDTKSLYRVPTRPSPHSKKVPQLCSPNVPRGFGLAACLAVCVGGWWWSLVVGKTLQILGAHHTRICEPRTLKTLTECQTSFFPTPYLQHTLFTPSSPGEGGWCIKYVLYFTTMKKSRVSGGGWKRWSLFCPVTVGIFKCAFIHSACKSEGERRKKEHMPPRQSKPQQTSRQANKLNFKFLF